MAGLKGSFSKGLTAINLKTSNFMEENKYKTEIATLEAEIEKLKFTVGEIVYKNWNTENFTLQSLSEEVESIIEKYDNIDRLKKEIEMLAEREKQILGQSTNERVKNTGKVFCSNCGNEVKAGHKFCEKCGNRLTDDE